MTTSSYFIIFITVWMSASSVLGQVCSPTPCGANTICQEATSRRAICLCAPGFTGDPFTYCKRIGCSTNFDCLSNQVCRDGNCINSSFIAADLCHPSPCGQNTKCSVINRVPVCTCLETYTGSPIKGCSHECRSNNECGIDAICNHGICECPKDFIGNPYKECRPECILDRDCPPARPACVYDVCKNPCIGACGVGADCNLRGLTPVCSCPMDYAGDPFVSCRPFTEEDLCYPNPCGTNAECTLGYDQQRRQRPVCNCRAEYTGNPFSHCSRSRGECEDDEECPDNAACFNSKCIDACINQCGEGATCQAKRHIAACVIAVY